MLMVADLFQIDNPEEYKLHTARWNGEKNPLDVFSENKEEWCNWNRWRNAKDEFSRQYIFSLIDFYHETNMWLFGGVFEVISRSDTPNALSYNIKEIDKYKEYVGRLKIRMEKPSRGRAFYLEYHYPKMEVFEILREDYQGEEFPGYTNIDHDFSSLKYIVSNQKNDWKGALQNMKGVYMIIDKKNGKKYIGSAYGEMGIWSRWEDYINSGHGNNDELKKLIKTKGYSYSYDNFKFVLLEIFPMKTSDEVIFQRENYWKNALLSRGKFGYNSN